MAVTNTVTGWYSPGNAMVRLYNDRNGAILNGHVMQAVVLGSYQGYRAISYTSTKGGNTFNNFYVLWGLASNQDAPASWFLNSNTWATAIAGNYQPSDPLETWAATLTRFQQNYVAYKASVIDNWSVSFISGQTVVQIASAGNRVSIALVYYSITTDAGVYIDASILYGYNGDISPAAVTVDTPGSANTLFSLGAVFPSTQLDSMAESLQEIADTDYQISLNHGASIFSVKGKVTT